MEYIKSFKEYKTLRRNFFSDLYFIFLALAVLIMPFDKTFPSLPVNLAALSALFCIVHNGRTAFAEMKPFLISASVYFIFLYAYSISENKIAALYDTRGKASLIFAPILIGFAKELTKKHLGTFLLLFIFSCFTFTVVSVGVAAVHFMSTHEIKVFFYNDLVKFTDIHPAYIGMYLSFCVVAISLFLIIRYQDISHKKRAWLLVLILWFVFYLLLLTSKTSLIFTIIFVNGIFLYWGYKNNKKFLTLFLFLFFNVAGILTLFALPTTKERMRLLFTLGDASYENSVEARRYIWDAIFSHTDDFFWKGLGNGDDTETLVTYYKEAGFKKGVNEKYNAHNQFLQVLLVSGIFGLIMYVSIYVYQFSLALRWKHYLYLFFLLIFILNCLTESMLETQSGIFFFAFTNAFLLKYHFPQKLETLA